jgi:hypothetical protein
MPCGNRLTARQASRLLEVVGLLVEVSDRVAGGTRRLLDKVPARGRIAVQDAQRDQVVVPAEAVLRPRVIREAEAEAAGHRRRVLQATEVEAGILSRLTPRLEAVLVVVVADRVVVLQEVRRFLRDRRARQMTRRTFLMELASGSLRIPVAR